MYTYYDANGMVVGGASQGCNSAKFVTWGTVTDNYTYESEPCWSIPVGENPPVPCTDRFAC